MRDLLAQLIVGLVGLVGLDDRIYTHYRRRYYIDAKAAAATRKSASRTGPGAVPDRSRTELLRAGAPTRAIVPVSESDRPLSDTSGASATVAESDREIPPGNPEDLSPELVAAVDECMAVIGEHADRGTRSALELLARNGAVPADLHHARQETRERAAAGKVHDRAKYLYVASRNRMLERRRPPGDPERAAVRAAILEGLGS